jgi:hypothetical protein
MFWFVQVAYDCYGSEIKEITVGWLGLCTWVWVEEK